MPRLGPCGSREELPITSGDLAHGLEVTAVLTDVCAGDRTRVDRLMPLLYDDFKALAASFLRREGRRNTLDPTSLVNEAYLRLVDQSRVDWRGRAHFFAVGAQAMRRILVDHARTRNRLKRGGDRQRVALRDDLLTGRGGQLDLLALDEALARLRELDPRQESIVQLRFFGGLSVAEVAEVLDVSKRTVENDWTMARAWLRRELDPT